MTDISNIKNAAGYIWNERKPRATSWIENKLNKPSVTPFTIEHTLSEMKNITLAIILSPLWVIFTLIHIVIFTLFHTKVIITAPFVALLQLLDATRKYGSQFIFTGVVIFISFNVAVEYTPILFEVVKETLS
jgi:hypothetical protein